MAASAATATFLCQVIGGLSGTRVVTATWSITVPLDIVQQQTLTQAAFNTFNIPANATLVVIVPPTTNTQSVTLKGITGDTGILLAKASPTVICPDPTQTTIGLALAAGTNQLFEFAVL